MTTFDLTPLYRSSIGFDRFGSLLDNMHRVSQTASSYPPYDIEVRDENAYAITIAVAGFDRSELDIQVEQGVLTVRGKKGSKKTSDYLYQGIANRAFERKFNLADHVEVTAADFTNGLLTISLVREIPEAMKPKTITINQSGNAVEHEDKAA
ncbi:MAG: heat-shock protein [Acidiferrobacteraceae bacterium]|jgi:molecular chaperone IbpA|nr:heat-shock protein [Acidiferrobacteraceae bacterium]|tara:strand:- start:654 stop:1109 length:456 start_codon:yes stop_codon:yes gene_type:complete